MDNEQEQSETKANIIPFIIRGETVIFDLNNDDSFVKGFGLTDEDMQHFSKFLTQQIDKQKTYADVLWNIYDEFGLKVVLMMAGASINFCHQQSPSFKAKRLKDLLEGLLGG